MDMFNHLASAAFLLPASEGSKPDPGRTPEPCLPFCDLCSRMFVDRKALLQHQLHKHGQEVLANRTTEDARLSNQRQSMDSDFSGTDVESVSGSSFTMSSPRSMRQFPSPPQSFCSEDEAQDSRDLPLRSTPACEEADAKVAQKTLTCEQCRRLFLDSVALKQHRVHKHRVPPLDSPTSFPELTLTSIRPPPSSAPCCSCIASPACTQPPQHAVSLPNSSNPPHSQPNAQLPVPVPLRASLKEGAPHPFAELSHPPLAAPLLRSAAAAGPRVLALDCEFVGVRCVGGPETNGLARVALVDEHCQLVYHSFCKPDGDVVDYRTQWSGVRVEDLEYAPSFREVRSQVLQLIDGAVLIGHDITNDLRVLQVGTWVVDTATLPEYQGIDFLGQKRALRDLMQEFFGKSIQQGEHNPLEDAIAAMMLYLRHCHQMATNTLMNRPPLQQSKQHSRGYRKHHSRSRRASHANRNVSARAVSNADPRAR